MLQPAPLRLVVSQPGVSCKGVFRPKVTNENQWKDTITRDVTSGGVNLAVHAMRITRRGVYRTSLLEVEKM